MRVAWVGTFVPAFSRNRRLADYLGWSGVEVTTVRVDLWPDDRIGAFETGRLRLSVRALILYPVLLFKLLAAPAPDVYLVSYPGWFDVPFVKLVARLKRRPLVFDIFISLYDTAISDRQLASESSLVGRAAKAIDRWSLRAADRVITDCRAHARFFESLAELEKGDVSVLYVGADETIFTPVDGIAVDQGLVFFYGTYVPLQGAEWIVRAAHLLEQQGNHARFVMVGNGQDRVRVERLAYEIGCRNIEFRDSMTPHELVREMHRAAVVLGIFGVSEKADRVIPHKVFDAVACGRAVLTGATSAVLEEFTGDEVATCPPGDHEALASSLKQLLEDPDRCRGLGRNARKAFVDRYSTEPQVERLSEALEAARR